MLTMAPLQLVVKLHVQPEVSTEVRRPSTVFTTRFHLRLTVASMGTVMLKPHLQLEVRRPSPVMDTPVLMPHVQPAVRTGGLPPSTVFTAMLKPHTIPEFRPPTVFTITLTGTAASRMPRAQSEAVVTEVPPPSTVFTTM